MLGLLGCVYSDSPVNLTNVMEAKGVKLRAWLASVPRAASTHAFTRAPIHQNSGSQPFPVVPAGGSGHWRPTCRSVTAGPATGTLDCWVFAVRPVPDSVQIWPKTCPISLITQHRWLGLATISLGASCGPAAFLGIPPPPGMSLPQSSLDIAPLYAAASLPLVQPAVPLSECAAGSPGGDLGRHRLPRRALQGCLPGPLHAQEVWAGGISHGLAFCSCEQSSWGLFLHFPLPSLMTTQ